MKHTPGKWAVMEEVLYQGNHVAGRMPAVINEDGNAIARVNRSANASLGGRCEQAEANARLIAAAPELLEALEACVLLMAACWKDDIEELVKARSAIAKAKGEA